MKSKIALILAAVTVPVTAVLRILQYMFVIDADGYFNTATALGKVLTWSLYGVYAVTAVVALLLLISRDRFSVRYSHISRSVLFRVMCFLIGAVLLFDGGYRFGTLMRDYNAKFDWIALFGVLTALFFVSLLSKKTKVLSSVLGLFPPVYICARGITEFFASFEKAQVSESKLELLSVCALALFTVTLCIMYVGINVKEKRVAALSLAVCAFCAPTSIARLISIATGEIITETATLDINWAIAQILLIILALIVLIRIQTNIYIEKEGDDSDDDDSVETADNFEETTFEQEVDE